MAKKECMITEEIESINLDEFEDDFYIPDEDYVSYFSETVYYFNEG